MIKMPKSDSKNSNLSRSENESLGYNYDSIPAGYYDQVFHCGFGIQSAWHRQKFQFLADLIPIDAIHLDIGCGPGTFLGNFSHAKKAIGVDIAADQIHYANSTYSSEKIHFIHLHDPHLPFENSYFDVVSMVEVIEHLNFETLNKLMTEALRVLKADGLLILSTPNYSSLWPALEWTVNKLAKISYDEQHISKFTPKTLAKFIDKFPLTLCKMGSYLFSSPFLAPLGIKISQKMFNLERRFSSRPYQFLLYVVARKNA